MGEDKTLSVMVADPQTLVADALGRALNQFGDLSVISEYPATGLAAVSLVELYHPQVLIVEYWMPELLAPAIIRAIQQKIPRCRTIVFSWLHGSAEIMNSIRAGASTFLPKTVSVDRLAEAVRQAASATTVVFEEEINRLVETLNARDQEGVRIWERMRLLSRRELQILGMLSRTITLQEIAASLSISPRTARNYLDSMLKKTETQSQVELLALARNCGLIS